MSVGAAVFYGIVHDMVTAHLCVDYFTVAHPFVFPSDDPVDMALIWGVLATWWVGLILGLGLAAAARLGSRPKHSARQLVPRIGRLLAAMASLALALGLIGYSASRLGWIVLVPPLSEQIPPERWNLFFFDAFAHTGSYLGGLVGGLILMLKTWRARGKANAQ